jgi:hypothetical protein
MAPAASAVTTVMVAPGAAVNSIAAVVVEVTGMQPWIKTTGSNAYNGASTALPPLVTGALGGSSIMLTMAGADNGSDTITVNGISRGNKSTLAVTAAISTTITWTTNPFPGQKILIAVLSTSSAGPTSVIDNGTTPRTYTRDASSTGSGHGTFIYRADNITLPTTGNYTVTITYSGSTAIVAGGVAYSGVKTGGPTATNAGNGTGTSVTSNTATPSAASALFFGAFEDQSGLNPETITLTAAGFIQQFLQTNGASNNASAIADKIDHAGPTGTAVTWTLGDSVAWDAAIAVYDAVSTWTQLSTVTCTDNSLTCSVAYQVGTSGVAGWVSSGAVEISGVLIAALGSATALVPRSPHWPVVVAEIAPASGFQTPPDYMTWIPINSAYLKLGGITQGRQFETSSLSTGEGTLTFDNPLGAVTPNNYTLQLQWHGNGAGEADAQANGFAVTGGGWYTFSTWVMSNSPWPLFAYFDWRDASNNNISFINGNQITANASGPQLVTVTGQAPASAASVNVAISGRSNPLTSVIFSAFAAYPFNTNVFSIAGLNGTINPIVVPATGSWGFNIAGTVLAPWVANNFYGISVGTPIRLRTAWTGGGYQFTFHGDGSTSTPRVSTENVHAPALPSTIYNANQWMVASADWSGGGQCQINWFDSGGTYISDSAIGSVASFSANVPVNLIGTSIPISPSNAAGYSISFQANGTPPAGTLFSCAPGFNGNNLPGPLGSANPYRTFTGATITAFSAWGIDVNGPPNNTPWYIPYSGFIERLPQQWDNLIRGFTEAAITDYWFSANFQPQPILAVETLNLNPYAYWPCTDAQAASSASNLALNNSKTLNVIQSKYGTGAVTQQFGQNGNAIFGSQSTLVVSANYTVSDGGGMWQLANTDNVALVPVGWSLECTDSNFPSIANGVSISIWVQSTSPFSANDQSVFVVGNNKGPMFQLYWFAHPTGLFALNQGGVIQDIQGADVTDYCNQQLVHVVLTFNQTLYTSYINGVQKVSNGTWTGVGNNLTANWSSLTVNGINGFTQGVYSVFDSMNFNGFTGQVAVFPYQLTPSEVNNIYLAGTTGMAGEPSHYRIERLLRAGNALSRRCILPDGTTAGTFTPVVSCQDIPSQAASQSISNLTGDLLPGMFYVAPTGEIVFLEKGYVYNQPVAWSIGDNPVNGEIPYDGSIKFDYDASRIINEIQLTQLDDGSVTIPSVTAIESASQALYGTITDQTTGYLQVDATYPYNAGPGLLDFANWLAVTFNGPDLRLSAVQSDSATYPAAWNFILSASVGDIVTVARRLPGATTPYVFVTGRITQTQREFEFSVISTIARLTIMIDPAPEEFALTCDDTVRGQLNSVDILGW